VGYEPRLALRACEREGQAVDLIEESILDVCAADSTNFVWHNGDRLSPPFMDRCLPSCGLKVIEDLAVLAFELGDGQESTLPCLGGRRAAPLPSPPYFPFGSLGLRDFDLRAEVRQLSRRYYYQETPRRLWTNWKARHVGGARMRADRKGGLDKPKGGGAGSGGPDIYHSRAGTG
jgi:hypothetical protein